MSKTETMPSPRAPRGERRKKETRARLLLAALRLMAAKGMDGVAINEITDAADVGFGSFYNHFDSKDAIYAALVEWVFERFANALDHALATLDDPAEVISLSIRHTLLRATREPLWGQFLIREGFSSAIFEHGLGRRLLRDIEKGSQMGRFVTEDTLMTLASVGGTVLAAASFAVMLNPAEPPPEIIVHRGFNIVGWPERTALACLSILGIDRSEAETIATRPLPDIGLAFGSLSDELGTGATA